MRKVLIVGAAVVATASAAFVVARLAPGDPTKADHSVMRGGPLTDDTGISSDYGQPVEIGRKYSYGLLSIKNMGDTPAVIDRAWLDHKQPGLKALGMYVLPLPNKYGIALVEDYRPSQGQRLGGYELVPLAQAQVVIGLALSEPGRASFRGVSLAYQVRDTRYLVDYDHSVRFCGPLKTYVGRCHPIGG